MKIIHGCQSIGGCANQVWVQVLPLTRRWWLCLGRLCNLEVMKWRWEKSGIWGVPYGLYPSWFQPVLLAPAGLRGEQAELPASTEWTEVPPPPPLGLSPHESANPRNPSLNFFPARYSVIVKRKATNKNVSWHD